MIVFLLAVVCITGMVRAVVNMEESQVHLSSINEESYFESWAFAEESYDVIAPLAELIGNYKSEEYILSGNALTKDDVRVIEETYTDGFVDSYKYPENLSEAEIKRIMQETYADEIKRKKEESIKAQLREYHRLLNVLQENKGIIYYASNGEQEFSNSERNKKEQFESYSTYMQFENYQQTIYPDKAEKSQHLGNLSYINDRLNPQTDVVYMAFEESFLQQKIQEWKKDKVFAQSLLNEFLIFLVGFIVTFIYLIVVIGRTSFKDKEVRLNIMDKLYNDLNIVIVVTLAIWSIIMIFEVYQNIYMALTLPFVSIVLLLTLSLVKHMKNRTIFSHTLIYQLLKKAFLAVKHVFDSGSIGVKVVLLVIGYPVIVAATFFIFPITIGVAAWLALKKVKSFNHIKEGVQQIKNGDFHHRIDVGGKGKGELSQLAKNINQITDGLKKSVDSEIKSERLKTELITNVSHDIRTPLTSIITYVDLLKTENDPEKVAEYIDVLDQKSTRLKHLTDDLFDAAKASSGSMPVQLERIDILSLLTQGIGEMDEKIEASALDFKLAHPTEKVYVMADGKLLWRSIENLFSNIFKYAQPASRVYIDVEDLESEVLVTFKNMSAYELNISADELMERFKRGDESRTSQGSGLGLSIAESLINIQRGKFIVQVDGDLFKAMIYLPKYTKE